MIISMKKLKGFPSRNVSSQLSVHHARIENSNKKIAGLLNAIRVSKEMNGEEIMLQVRNCPIF